MSVYWNDGTSLYHFGILGMKWGRRRYQNEDGTYTEEGRRRYGIGDGKSYKKLNNVSSASSKPTNNINVKRAAVVSAGVLGAAAVAGLTLAYFKNEADAQNTVNRLMEEFEYRSGRHDTFDKNSKQLAKEAEEALADANNSPNGPTKVGRLMGAAYMSSSAKEYTEKAIHEGKQALAVMKELSKADPTGKYRSKYEQKKKSLKGVSTVTPNRVYIDRFVPD